MSRGTDVALAWEHHRAGRRAEAERVCFGLLQRDPNHPAALQLLAVMAQGQKRPAVALKLAAMAVAAAPHVAEYHDTLGTALGDLRRWDEAVAAFGEALRLRPDSFHPRHNLGTALAKAGRLPEAAAAYREAVRHAPGPPEALQTYEDLIAVCHEAGDTAGLIDARRRTVDLRPGDAALHSQLLYTLHCEPGLSPPQIFNAHREWAERHEAPLRAARRPHANDPDPERRLRIGYVSGGFRAHPVARFQEAALVHRDRERFEVTCYAAVDKPDATTERLKGWRTGGWTRRPCRTRTWASGCGIGKRNRKDGRKPFVEPMTARRARRSRGGFFSVPPPPRRRSGLTPKHQPHTCLYKKSFYC